MNEVRLTRLVRSSWSESSSPVAKSYTVRLRNILRIIRRDFLCASAIPENQTASCCAPFDLCRDRIRRPGQKMPLFRALIGLLACVGYCIGAMPAIFVNERQTHHTIYLGI